ncbi:MAG: ATP-binding protein [Bacteroidia bacterium]
MKKVLLLLCLCSIYSFLYPQNSDRAWLETALAHTESGSERVDLLIRLADLLHATQADDALEYAEEAEKLAEELGYDLGIANAKAQIGFAFLQLDKTRRGIRKLEDALPYLQKIGDKALLLPLYERLSWALTKQGKADEALTYKQLTLAIKQQDFSDQAADRIVALEDSVDISSEAAKSARALAKRTLRQRDVAESALMEQEAALLQQELELAHLQEEAAKLEMDKMHLEMETMENELRLQKVERRNFWLGAAFFAALALGLGIWQWYRIRQARKMTEIEKQQTEELRKIDQLKDQFLANTSHELRTPLNGMIGLAEALYEGSETHSSEVRKENLALIISAGRRLNNLVNDLLDFSKMQQGALEVQTRAVDLRSLTEIVLKINESSAKNKALFINNLVPEDLPPIQADEDRLQQVLINLVNNGIKFTTEGSVSVSAREKGDRIQISVSDTGIGIPEEKQDAIFEAFVQADGSIQRQYGGTGLGLTICRQLVELQDGRIWVESIPEEGSKESGTTFHILLPKASPEAEVLHPSKVAFEPTPLSLKTFLETPEKAVSNNVSLKPPTENRPFHILIVDDEIINHQVLKHHLAHPKFNLTVANNGAEALAALEQEVKFDLVLLDIMMPHMSGFEVCQRIRQKYLASELPVIMVTAKNQVEDLVAGLDHGANDYIAKPFSRDELLARIQAHLNLYHLNEVSMRFVPNEFLSSLGYESLTDVKLGDHVQQEVTVFFSDIRGYTALSEQMSPEENFRFVNAYVGRMGPIIREHGGFVNQYLGDGIMALFMDGPEKAIQAAVKMQAEISEYNIYRKKLGRAEIKVGMGIHTGPLIMGVIGDRLRNDTATISDAVNTASRMEGLTKFYGANLLVSEATLKALDDPTEFDFRYLGQVQVKGKKIAIGVYEFFDADLDSDQTLKWGAQQPFEQGLRHYYAREFKDAITTFGEVLHINPADKAAQHYLERAKTYNQIGVPDNWQGVELMDHK